MDSRNGSKPSDTSSDRAGTWPLLDFVRPGANAHTWLAGVIRDLKADDPFRPVTVLVPNNYAGRFARWQLARDGGYLNVTMLRLALAAEEIFRGDRVDEASRVRRVQTIVEESAVRKAVAGTAGDSWNIKHRSLHVTLLELFRELRRREVDVDSIDLASLTATAQVAFDVYREFSRLLERSETTTSILNFATRRLNEAKRIPAGLDRLGALVLWLPSRLDPAEARFLAAASRWVPLVAGFVEVGDSQELADAPGIGASTALAEALHRDPPVFESTTGLVLDIDRVRVIRAPDPAEEVREVVRAIAANVEAKVPLHRIALVYRQGDPYGALARDTLDAAGLPWVSSEGLRLSESRPGRCLLGLLKLPEQSFTRESLMEWLETGPIQNGPIATISTASWDRLSRAANVVRGAEQWQSRLHALADALEAEADIFEREDRSPSQVEVKRGQAADALIVRDYLAEIGRALEAPPATTRWSGFVKWALQLRDRFVGRPDQWPETQRIAAGAVDDVLQSLDQLDRIDWEGGIDLARFLDSLEGALDARRIPTGQIGEGILVEPVTALNGLSFEKVYLVGLVDGAFPPAPSADPFFPAGGPDPLLRRPRQVAKERQDFLIALAAADGGDLTVTAPDSDGQRAAIPSRWLIEIASARSGVTLDASTFKSLDRKTHPWLRVMRSAQEAVLSAEVPADLEDRRLREAADWWAQGYPLSRHFLGHRDYLPLGRAIELRRGRSSASLSRFDGNVGELAGQSRKLASFGRSGGVISASAIQSWASCGYRYFLERVIVVEPTKKPDESVRIDSLERGSLIHQVLEDFYKALARDGRPNLAEPYRQEDFALIDSIAADQFVQLERRGVTGHPLIWDNLKGSILADLRTLLSLDATWRATQGVKPTYFEQSFGMGARDPNGWPPLDVSVESGTLRFRGVIDRIDLDASGTRAAVFDYKTGSAGSYAALKDDPVAAGQHIQLALYSQAVRANLPSVDRLSSAFWFISTRGGFEQLSVTDDPMAVDVRLSEVLDIVTRGIGTGAFPQIPGPRANGNFANCSYCDFDRICAVRRDKLARQKSDDPSVAIHASLGTRADEGDDG